ncbi:hypothetical protein [Streptomyces sp. NBC_00691]|uniref:hypothetical protein n=1 Tax=Streptomyces sp. NBC_00691 TaxID=2903671 RepID=UPI002E2FF048|nr:hypothetical protein [Streptomyces sp. NBC_00691]
MDATQGGGTGTVAGAFLSGRVNAADTLLVSATDVPLKPKFTGNTTAPWWRNWLPDDGGSGPASEDHRRRAGVRKWSSLVVSCLGCRKPGCPTG